MVITTSGASEKSDFAKFLVRRGKTAEVDRGLNRRAVPVAPVNMPQHWHKENRLSTLFPNPDSHFF